MLHSRRIRAGEHMADAATYENPDTNCRTRGGAMPAFAVPSRGQQNAAPAAPAQVGAVVFNAGAKRRSAWSKPDGTILRIEPAD